MIIFRYEAYIIDLKIVLQRLSLYIITSRCGIGNLLGKWITLLWRRGQSTAYFMDIFMEDLDFSGDQRGRMFYYVFMSTLSCATLLRMKISPPQTIDPAFASG